MATWKQRATELVGTREIADRLGISHPETIHSWRRRYDDFPEPIGQLSGVFVWAWPDVEKWAKSTGRLAAKSRANRPIARRRRNVL